MTGTRWSDLETSMTTICNIVPQQRKSRRWPEQWSRMGAVKMRARLLARRVPDVVKSGCRQLRSLDQRNLRSAETAKLLQGTRHSRRSADEATNLCRLPDRPGDKPALAYQRRNAYC